STGKGLPAFRPDEIHQRHEYSVLLRDVTRETLPAFEIGGNGSFILARPNAPGRRRSDNVKRRRAVERSNGPGEAVPRVFADQHRRSARWRIERADLEAAID